MAGSVFCIFLVYQVFHVAQLRRRRNLERIVFGTVAAGKNILDAISFTFGKEGRVAVIHGIVLLVGVAEHNGKAARSHCRRRQGRRIRHCSGSCSDCCRRSIR